MNREHRAYFPSEVRVDGENPRRFEADVLVYGVLDTYKTIFDPGVFDKSLEERLPKITWGHDWTDPIGRYVDYKNVEQRDTKPAMLRMIGELDNFEAVPRARQASAQLASGTIDQFSVGFHRNEGGTYEDDDGITHFRSAGLDEVALVLVGAVPGTKLVSVRSAQSGLSVVRRVEEELVVSLGIKMQKGEITYDEAMAVLALASGEAPEGKPAEEVPEAPDLSDVLAEADELLDA